MKKILYLQVVFILFSPLISQNINADNNWSGSFEFESQYFVYKSYNEIQSQRYNSVAFQPQYIQEWGNGKHLLQFSAFSRINTNNTNRNHSDIRELYWAYISDNWELRTGIQKVFWGVTESQNLVDILNQTDLVERFDGEEKLGQPMLNFTYIKNWGVMDFYILPFFRERMYPSVDSRLRIPVTFKNNSALYESSLENKNIDLAIRYSHYVGNWDFGISHFYGTNREPRIIINDNKPTQFYDLIQQTGLDIQATFDNWLWKIEGIRRSGMLDTYTATTFGFEYSFFNIKNTSSDVGVVVEFLYDDRGQLSTSPFQNDTLLGFRLALNDSLSTEALIGIIYDNKNNGNILSLEGSRRINENFKISIESYLFFDTKQNDVIYYFRNDDVIQITLARYY